MVYFERKTGIVEIGTDCKVVFHYLDHKNILPCQVHPAVFLHCILFLIVNDTQKVKMNFTTSAIVGAMFLQIIVPIIVFHFLQDNFW